MNQLDSSASKRQRQQHSYETDEQEMQLVSGPPMMVLTVACTSVTGVLGGVPDDITVSPELPVY